MIELLSGWLKQIVVLVLLAVFMDLLLPNNSMDRYVKLVMGLLIILAMISPIFQWIHQDLDLTQLTLDTAQTEEKKLPSLSGIQQESKRLTRTQDRLVREEAQRRLEQTITTEVEQRFRVKVDQIRVQTEAEAKKVGISQVSLTVHPAEKEAKEEISPVQQVEEVKPVRIDGGGERKRGGVEKENSSSTQSVWEKKITRYLAKTLQLQDRQVHVEVLQGNQGR
ncbi:stage III sporulation protein AF [Kroppenstedtia sanguinis]|uniref:Stage III sporulation protein AF n=1 Tax=Kroppenstedtia sanguinis TaxID=1380684 RepID=A0ABW4CDQ7_9BACL